MNLMFIRARYNYIQLIILQRNWRKSLGFYFHCHSRRVAMVWNDMQWYSFSLPFLLLNDMQGYVLHSHTLPFLLMQWYARICLHSHTLPFLLMQTFWMDTHCMDTYWWDMYWTDTYWWDTYWWDTFWMDMCGICVVWWICVGYVWCEIRQQSSEEPCDETSFGKKKLSHSINIKNIIKYTCPTLSNSCWNMYHIRPFGSDQLKHPSCRLPQKAEVNAAMSRSVFARAHQAGEATPGISSQWYLRANRWDRCAQSKDSLLQGRETLCKMIVFVVFVIFLLLFICWSIYLFVCLFVSILFDWSIFHVSSGGVELQKPRESVASKLHQIPLPLTFCIIHVHGDPSEQVPQRYITGMILEAAQRLATPPTTGITLSMATRWPSNHDQCKVLNRGGCKHSQSCRKFCWNVGGWVCWN